MKKIKKIIATMLALVCVLTAFPTMEAKAGTDILEGGYETKETTFPWGNVIKINVYPIKLKNFLYISNFL